MARETTHTSIKDVFKIELFFIKLFGGFLFDTNKYVSRAYRIGVVILCRYVTASYYIRYQKLLTDATSKASMQNIRLFLLTLNLARTGAHIGTIWSGIRYHNLFMILLNKKLHSNYLFEGESDNSVEVKSLPTTTASCAKCARPLFQQQASSVQVSSPSSSSSSYSSSTSPTLALIKDEPEKSLKNVSSGRKQVDEQQSDTIFHPFGREIPRIKMARILVISYLIISGILALLNDELGPKLHLKSSSARRYLPPKANRQPLPIDYEAVQAANATGGGGILLYLGFTPASWFGQREYRQSAEQKPSMLVSDLWAKFLQDYGRRSQMRAALVEILRLAGMLLFHLVHSTMNIFQVYGQAIVTWMITALLTDMLAKSSRLKRSSTRKLEQLCAECRTTLSSVKQTRNISCDVARALGGSGEMRGKQRRRRRAFRQTTELLVQVRDALIALRTAMSLDYLVLLVFDMSRLMSAFCLFSAFISTDRLGLVLLLFVRYLHIVIGILLTCLGYHDLHAQVHRIRVAHERQLIELAASANNVSLGAAISSKLSTTDRKSTMDNVNLIPSTPVSSANSSTITLTSLSSGTTYYPLNQHDLVDQLERPGAAEAKLPTISRTEASTAYRLAREIEELWPTTWYTPDLRSYVSQNVFVFTFVATLQQLVEASAKVEYQGQQGLKTDMSGTVVGNNGSEKEGPF